MTSLTNKQYQNYLELVTKLADEQYDSNDDFHDIISKMEWMPAESEAKEKMLKSNASYGSIDLTNVHSSKIKEEILKNGNFKAGNFKISVKRFSGPPPENEIFAYLRIWEERNKTPNGMPCKLDFAVNFAKDTRFCECSWVKHFGFGNSSDKIPLATIIEIARYLQFVSKYPAFI